MTDRSKLLVRRTGFARWVLQQFWEQAPVIESEQEQPREQEQEQRFPVRPQHANLHRIVNVPMHDLSGHLGVRYASPVCFSSLGENPDWLFL